MNMRVSDVKLWWDHITAIDLASRYGVKTRAPQMEDWGLVAGVIDPPGCFGGSPRCPAPHPNRGDEQAG